MGLGFRGLGFRGLGFRGSCEVEVISYNRIPQR